MIISSYDQCLNVLCILYVLQPPYFYCRDTIGVILLTKMGWKPGQGIGPRISRMEKRLQKRKTKQEKKANARPGKVYGCASKPPSSSEESDGSKYPENLSVTVLC